MYVPEKRRCLPILRRSLCLMLCLLLLPLIACDTKKSSSEEQSFSDLDFTSQTYPEEQAYFAPIELTYSSFSEDQTVNALAMTTCGEELAVLVRSNSSDWTYSTTQVCFFDQTGTQTGGFGIEAQLKIQDVTVTYIAGTNVGVTTYVTYLDEKSLTMVQELCFFDKNGNETREAFPVSFSDETFSLTSLKALTSGETVLGGVNGEGNMFYVYGTHMQLLYTITGDQLTGEIIESGGNVYVIGQETSQDGQKTLFYLVDPETGKLSEAIDVSEILGTGLSSCSSGNLYVEDTTNLFSIDLDSSTITTLLTWSEQDINRSVYSFTSPICVLSEDVVCILGTSYGTNNDVGYDLGVVVMLIRQDQNPNSGKETIILGGFDIAFNDALLEAVDAFNKTSDAYRVEIVDYIKPDEQGNIDYEQCMQQMYLDVYTGEGPDIIYSKGTGWYTTVFSLAEYEANDLLLDLYPLMEADPDFDIDDYLPNVIEACTIGGELCKIPIHFSVYGIAAEPSVTNGITGWTPDEFDEIATTLPSEMQMISEMTQLDLLSAILAGSMSCFIDEDTNEVNFETEEFYSILELAKEYGEPEPEDGSWPAGGAQTCCGHCMIYGTVDFSYCFPMSFSTTPDIIGFPSPDKVSSYIYPEEEVAISSWCDCPEGAWAFVKYLLSEEYQTENSFDYMQAYGLPGGYGFPIRTDSLQTIIDLAMDPPDIEFDGSDTEYVPIILTQEQADACLAAIEQSDTLYYLDLEIYSIIEEEVQAYFQDQKSVEEVCALISDRVQTLVNERG